MSQRSYLLIFPRHILIEKYIKFTLEICVQLHPIAINIIWLLLTKAVILWRCRKSICLCLKILWVIDMTRVVLKKVWWTFIYLFVKNPSVPDNLILSHHQTTMTCVWWALKLTRSKIYVTLLTYFYGPRF